MAEILYLHGDLPEQYLVPSFNPPPGDIPLRDARTDIDGLISDMRFGWDYAQLNNLAVLSVNADRFGAYLHIAPTPSLHVLLGDECDLWREFERDGLVTELWVATVENVRLFWREVKCAKH